MCLGRSTAEGNNLHVSSVNDENFINLHLQKSNMSFDQQSSHQVRKLIEAAQLTNTFSSTNFTKNS